MYTKAEFVIYVKFKFNRDILNFDLLKVATVVQEPAGAKTEEALAGRRSDDYAGREPQGSRLQQPRWIRSTGPDLAQEHRPPAASASTRPLLLAAVPAPSSQDHLITSWRNPVPNCFFFFPKRLQPAPSLGLSYLFIHLLTASPAPGLVLGPGDACTYRTDRALG